MRGNLAASTGPSHSEVILGYEPKGTYVSIRYRAGLFNCKERWMEDFMRFCIGILMLSFAARIWADININKYDR